MFTIEIQWKNGKRLASFAVPNGTPIPASGDTLEWAGMSLRIKHRFITYLTREGVIEQLAPDRPAGLDHTYWKTLVTLRLDENPEEGE